MRSLAANPCQHEKPRRGRQPHRSLAKVVTRALAAGLLVAAIAGCSGLPDPPDETAKMSAEEIYEEAKTSQKDGIYDKAIKMFEKLEARYPFGRFAQQAQIEIAYTHFKAGDPASAVAACDRFLKLYPNHRNADYVYYLKGLVTFNANAGLFGRQDPTERDPKGMRESFEAFKSLVSRFPESKYAPDATDRMNWLVNALASHEIHVARYYLKRGAYLAAINRAQDVIRNYSQAPAVEDALYISVLAYDKLGMGDLRDDSERVLKKNFPNSTLYSRGIEPQTAWWKLW